MALAKRVKMGGGTYIGYAVSVGASTGAYPVAIIAGTKNFVVNGISVTPDVYGVGDTFDLYHVSTTATVGGTTLTTLATGINNIGAGVTVALDFPTLENVEPGESLRFVYNNTAATALNAYLIVECIR